MTLLDPLMLITLQNDGSPVPRRRNHNFIGCTFGDDAASDTTTITPGGGGGSSLGIKIEGVPASAVTWINFVGFLSAYSSPTETMEVSPQPPRYPEIRDQGEALAAIRNTINVTAPLHAVDSASPEETEITYKEVASSGDIHLEGGTGTADPNYGSQSAVIVNVTSASILEIVADGQKLLFSVALDPTSTAPLEIRRQGVGFTHITLDNSGPYNWVDFIKAVSGWVVYRAGKTTWPVS